VHVGVSAREQLAGWIRHIELHRQGSRSSIDSVGGSSNRGREMVVRQFGQIHRCFCPGLDLLAEFFGHRDKYPHDVILRNVKQLAANAGIARVDQIAKIRFS
jgi:hypothetical protein